MTAIHPTSPWPLPSPPSGAEPKTSCLHRNRRTLASLSGAMAALGLAVEMKAFFQVIRLTQTATLATQKRHSSGRVMVLTWSA